MRASTAVPGDVFSKVCGNERVVVRALPRSLMTARCRNAHCSTVTESPLIARQYGNTAISLVICGESGVRALSDYLDNLLI
jgi:hypothetical protein